MKSTMWNTLAKMMSNWMWTAFTESSDATELRIPLTAVIRDQGGQLRIFRADNR